MKDKEKIEQHMFDMKNRAYKIIHDLKIIETWEKIGARVNLVGSLKMGLLVKHRDIDFHIYTNDLSPVQALKVIAELAHSPGVKKIEYSNLSDKEDCCLEFHLWIEDDIGELWQIDMINIKSNSKYDGYFEQVADTVLKQMTKEQKQLICELKYVTPDTEKIAGIEYYKAVIQDNIKSWNEFVVWRKQQSFSGIIEW